MSLEELKRIKKLIRELDDDIRGYFEQIKVLAEKRANLVKEFEERLDIDFIIEHPGIKKYIEDSYKEIEKDAS